MRKKNFALLAVLLLIAVCLTACTRAKDELLRNLPRMEAWLWMNPLI